MVCPYQKLSYRPGPYFADPGNLCLPVRVERRRRRKVGGICGKDAEGGEDALRLHATVCVTETSHILPPGMLCPYSVLQLAEEAVVLQIYGPLTPQFNKLWFKNNLKEAWEPTFHHEYSPEPPGKQPLSAMREIQLTTTQVEHDSAVAANIAAAVGTKAPVGYCAQAAAVSSITGMR